MNYNKDGTFLPIPEDIKVRNVTLNRFYFTFEAETDEDFYKFFDFYKTNLNLNKWYRSIKRSICGVHSGWRYYIIPLHTGITLKEICGG